MRQILLTLVACLFAFSASSSVEVPPHFHVVDDPKREVTGIVTCSNFEPGMTCDLDVVSSIAQGIINHALCDGVIYFTNDAITFTVDFCPAGVAGNCVDSLYGTFTGPGEMPLFSTSLKWNSSRPDVSVGTGTIGIRCGGTK